MTPTQQPPVQPQQPPQQPRPTSGKENNKAFFFALGGVALVLAIVLMLATLTYKHTQIQPPILSP